MKQPGLGKKVASLRMEKGLTQAELAQLCNVTVRTIQRIESGETQPRSFTVKTIFSSMGEEAYGKDFSHPGTARFSERLADLFNLKTNTMKKLMILSSPLVVAIGALFVTSSGFAQNAQVEKALSEANSDFVSAFNSGKIETVRATYLDNACSVPGPSQEICGSANIASYFTELYAHGFRFTDLKSKSVSVTDSVAIDKGTWSASANGQKLSGTYLTQWRLKDGKWKIENESSNVDLDLESAQNALGGSGSNPR